MIFIVLITIGILGIIGTLWLSSASLRYVENPIPEGREWFSVSPEVLESRLGAKIRQLARDLLKKILIWLIGIYRNLYKKVTVKQTLKKKVRAFLYDHTPEGVRHPSEFWSQVTHKQKKPRAKKTTETEITESLSETPENKIENPE